MNRILLLVLLGVVAAGPVSAHRLTVDWQVVDNALVLRARTDDAPASGADLQLRSEAGITLASGTLDEAGAYRWPLSATGDVTVVVNAGLGHRRTLVLSETDLRPAPAPPNPASTEVPPRPVTGNAIARGSDDGSSPLAVRVVLGLTFLLATLAAGMSYRNARRLAKLEQKRSQHESRS